MIFERKKIQSETLGEYLLAIRSSLQLTQNEVVKKTGIQFKFLQSLEKGDFSILPADVYVFGFLKKLASLYTIDPLGLIEQYKKEKGIQKQLTAASGILNPGWEKSAFRKLVITPKILTIGIGVIFVVLSVSYIVWQVWSINRTPNLRIFEPTNNEVIKSSFVQIRGQTDPGISISVNNQSLFVDSKGGFQAQLSLSPGPESIMVMAQNSFGKSVSQTINLVGINEVEATSTPVLAK
jgi:cytoskeletal protein RodZ